MRRTFVLHTVAIVGVLTAFHVFSQQASLGALGGASFLAALVLAVSYTVTARRVWLTMSSAGIASIGYTGRKIELSWSTTVRVVASRRSGFKGSDVAEQGLGVLRTSTTTVFIPAAIATSPEFASAVAAWAPAGHPFHALAKSAA